MTVVNYDSELKRAGAHATQGWRRLAAKHELKITISGWPALCTFSFDDASAAPALRTLLTQEMLERGYLANTAFYPTLAHTPQVIERYLSVLDDVFAILRDTLADGDVAGRLKGPIAHSGFGRLT